MGKYKKYLWFFVVFVHHKICCQLHTRHRKNVQVKSSKHDLNLSYILLK